MSPVSPVIQPVVWTALGYPFEAASMLAGLSACLIVRLWICLKDTDVTLRARALNIVVTGIGLLFSAGWVLLQRPSPFYALLSGSGFGALGSGIIVLSLRWIERISPIAGGEAHDVKARTEPALRRIEDVRARARHAQHHRQKRRD
jgi:hypothetical protein